MTTMDMSTLVIVVLAALAAVGVYHLAETLRRALVRSHFRAADIRDPANQLRFVMSATFAKKRVMNRSEYAVFKVVEDECGQHRGLRVFAQTSLGEVLQSRDIRAHQSINSKRVDILVIAPDGYPLMALEFQGRGHYQGAAAARDAVKKEALRKAEVQYLEISDLLPLDEVRAVVRSALARAANSPTRTEARAASPPRSATVTYERPTAFS